MKDLGRDTVSVELTVNSKIFRESYVFLQDNQKKMSWKMLLGIRLRTQVKG